LNIKRGKAPLDIQIFFNAKRPTESKDGRCEPEKHAGYGGHAGLATTRRRLLAV
jgi:hypothetical protein